MRDFILDFDAIRGSTLSKGIRYSSILGESSLAAVIAAGPISFNVQTGLMLTVGQRIRASLAGPPLFDRTIFVEGPMTSYVGTVLDFTVDTYAGPAGASYNSWQLSAAVNLTGGSWDAVMRLNPDSCAGRNRNPVPLTINVTSDPTTGVFIIYLTPAQTNAVALGQYSYRVLFTPMGSSDKLLVVRGTINMVDE